LAAATQLHERRLLQCTCSAFLCFFQRARQQRVAVACFAATRAEEAARYWLHQWHSAVGKWRQEQVKETEAIMHWYLVLAASALCHWQRWLQKRQRKKQRQAEAAKLFARAARGAALKAALWRFDEERSVHEEVASLRSALLHKKRVEVALRVGQHWRTRAYVRATSRQVFLHRHELDDTWPSPIAGDGLVDVGLS